MPINADQPEGPNITTSTITAVPLPLETGLIRPKMPEPLTPTTAPGTPQTHMTTTSPFSHNQPSPPSSPMSSVIGTPGTPVGEGTVQDLNVDTTDGEPQSLLTESTLPQIVRNAKTKRTFSTAFDQQGNPNRFHTDDKRTI